jgi:hypothetical protein
MMIGAVFLNLHKTFAYREVPAAFCARPTLCTKPSISSNDVPRVRKCPRMLYHVQFTIVLMYLNNELDGSAACEQQANSIQSVLLHFPEPDGLSHPVAAAYVT